MTESVREDNSGLVTIELLIDGSAIPASYAVLRIQVERAINNIPFASITIEDGSTVDADFAGSASREFVPGGEIEIKLGYRGRNKTVFKGLVLRQNIRVNAKGKSCLVLGCHDQAIRTTLVRTSTGFSESTDSDAITQLLANSGLSANVEATPMRFESQIKNFATDWDFILSRAEANGQVVTVSDGNVSVAKPDFSRRKLVAEYGDTISELNLELDATQQFTEVRASAWDPVGQKVIAGNSSEPVVNQQGNITGAKLADVMSAPTFELHTQSPASEDELEGWANAQLMRSRLSRIRGTVKFDGNAGVDPGNLLALDGLGKRFNGSGYVAAVRHDVRDGNWTTEVELGLSARAFAEVHREINAAPAGAQRPATNGLHIAKVRQTHDDPQGQRRVQVSLPLHGNDDEGVWVRNISPYASGDAGIEFMPEIGDEVIVGFLADDPNAGIILGSLHSSALPSPIVPDETNAIKAIVTRSQLKMTFDDENKAIVIETPGGHMVSLSDADASITLTDSNSNTVSMSETGIAMASPGDISIEAAGSISITGQTGVAVESSADVGVKGGASAELSANGQTTVKGSIVSIN